MNKTDALQYAYGIPGHFFENECEALYDYAIKEPLSIAEIGVLYGRSTSLLLSAAEETGALVTLIDYWPKQHDACMPSIGKLITKFEDLNFIIMHMPSDNAPRLLGKSRIGLIHIDGNHQVEGIEADCANYLPLLSSGGVACFHDYGKEEFPGVTDSVDRHTKGWHDLGVVGSLAIRRKP